MRGVNRSPAMGAIRERFKRYFDQGAAVWHASDGDFAAAAFDECFGQVQAQSQARVIR